MDIYEAINNRHSVRSYLDKRIPDEIVAELLLEIKKCNEESGLNLQLVTNEPKAFSGVLAHYGKFVNVKNYIALVGKKDKDLDEKLGYYGERIVLKSFMMGLDTCWVGATYSKSKCACEVNPGEILRGVISIGYGENKGKPHKNKPLEKLCKVEGPMPDWFLSGMKAAMLAPTAVNQQKFLFTLKGNTIKAEETGGFYSKMDLGIVKYHFEIGAGMDNCKWI
ncbi:nitroreductase family protein [Oxobacter pfennigii]|uniref:Nitroreductase family protein n=1 Tax=Oxobacter pfennigii TaxID=36849 RepID=A0A0P8YWB8_9CLOT|nr:nitroreductase family protein [Oxobacter pfennigii]KPU44014.1 nitroreductase family protein [Oxobacter pfennigii]